jgi:isocitrate/isopropylmalate dehydrogenase
MAWDGNRYGDGAGASTISNLGTVTGVTGPIHVKELVVRADPGNTGVIYIGGTKGTLTTAGAYAIAYLEAGASRRVTECALDLAKIQIIGSDGNQKAYVDVVYGPKK